jgi:hypothetical protein
LGLAAGYGRAWLFKRPYTLPAIERTEIALLAFLPQAIVFFIPQTSPFFSQQWAAIVLPLSLALLMLFVWFNRRVPAFWVLGLGLLLNFAVIVANGGLMPVSPENMRVIHGAEAEAYTNSRDFGSKGVVLPVEATRLEWLADRFTVPDAWPIQFAYSLGDVFLVVGVFWVLWAGGASRAQLSSTPAQVISQAVAVPIASHNHRKVIEKVVEESKGS